MQYLAAESIEFIAPSGLLPVSIIVFSRAPSLLPSNLHSPSRRDRGIHPTERGNRGRHQKDRRQGGTQEAQAYGAQEGSAQGQAHHSARLAEEKSEEDGPRPEQAVRTGVTFQVSGVRGQVSGVSFWRSSVKGSAVCSLAPET